MKLKRQKWLYMAMVGLITFALCGSLYARYEDLKQGPERLLETGKTVIG